MRFRRSEGDSREFRFAGESGVVDGQSAVLHVERLTGDVLVVPSARDADALVAAAGGALSGGAENASASALRVHEASAREIPALVAGYALEGQRASALIERLGAGADSLAAMAGRRLALVVHLVSRARTRQSAAVQGAHDDYHAAADSGAFLMFAKNPQEAADFAMIARRVAELSLTPGVCAQDLYQTSHSVQNVMLPGGEFAAAYLGHSDDTIPCAGEAQKVMFGDTRRRVPVLLDVDRPAGIGGVQDRESHFRAVAAQRPYFAGQLPAIIDEAMRVFGESTGRAYQRVSGYRVDDAEIVVVGQGAVMDDLVAVVDHLRRDRKIKAGLVTVSVLRPFAGGALSHLLAGRKAVVVLDRTESPLSDSPPLFAEVRTAIDRATENGRPGETAPYPDHATLRRLEDRPRLFSGVYGVGGDTPSFGDLVAVFERAGAKTGARRFYLGAGFDTETRRFPHLQSLQQQLAREYPGIESLALKPSAALPALPENDGAFQIRSLSMQGGIFAGNLFAEALAAASGWSVRTFPDGGLERNLQPASLTTAYAKKAGASLARPVELAAVLVSGEEMFEALPLECPLSKQGTLIVASVQEPEALWRGLSRRAANWVRAGEVRFHVLDARKIAAEVAAHASFIDQLSIWALLGAYARTGLWFDAETAKNLQAALRATLEKAAGADKATCDAIAKAFTRGAEEAKEVAWSEWSDATHALGEPDAPWTVRDAAHSDGTVFDPVRFWHSVGYLYDRGQSALTLADPHLASGIVPARSSAFRDMTRYRLRVPEWLPSKCTGCADCWVQCPESALPPTIRSIGELFDAATRECEKSGAAFVQLKRLGDALVKQAYKVAQQSGPQPYETIGAVLDDAFARVADKAGLSGDKLDAVKAEFDRLRGTVDGFPIAVTDVFFGQPQAKSAGSGRLLSIALNPLACTACGVCVEVCPEGAFAWAGQTPERLAKTRRDWEFLMHLPPLSREVVGAFVRDDEADTQGNRLLDGAAYHSLVGGDGSFPGNGAKTAVHLLTATIESAMRPRYEAHAARLARLIEKIEQRIQGEVNAATRINDFEEFGQRLSRVAGGSLTPEMLRGIASEPHAPRTVDAAQLTRLSELLRVLREQHRAYTDGDGRARLVMTIDPASGSFWSGTYPYNPHPQPWASHLPGDAAALARGVCEGLVRRLAAEFAAVRAAELELEGAFDPARHADPAAMSWRDLTRDERRLVPPVVVLTDAASTDSSAVAAVLASGLPIRVALVDHEGLALDGDLEYAARQASIPALHTAGAGTAFVLQTSIGYPGHLMQGVAESMEREGPALYRIHAPDPVSDGLASEDVVEVARLASDSRAVPLFVARPDGARAGLSLDGNPAADADWSTREVTVKDPAGTASTLTSTVTVADWAARQARFRRHFKIVSKGNRGAQTKPLAEYLALAPDARAGLEPYIDVRDRAGRHAVALVSDEMVRAAEHAAAVWRELRAVARGTTPAASRAAQAVSAGDAPATVAPAGQADARALATLTESLLRLSGYGQDDSFFARRLREFVAQDKGTNGDRG